jgi:hypothetical protein
MFDRGSSTPGERVMTAGYRTVGRTSARARSPSGSRLSRNPYPDPALSSNREVDPTGPRPAGSTAHGVVGREGRHRQAVALPGHHRRRHPLDELRGVLGDVRLLAGGRRGGRRDRQGSEVRVTSSTIPTVRWFFGRGFVASSGTALTIPG